MQLLKRIMVVCLVVGTLHAQLGDAVKDRLNGYSLAAPAGWPKIPTQPDETWVVGKWKAKREYAGIDPEISVYRFPKNAKAEEDEADDDERDLKGLSPEELRAEIQRRMRRREKAEVYTGYAAWLKDNDRFNRDGLPAASKDVAVKTFTTKAKVYHTTKKVSENVGGGRPIVYWNMHVVLDTPDAEWAIRFDADESLRKKFEDVFIESVKSFRLIDRKESELASDAEAVAGLSEKAKAMRVARMSSLQVPGWWVKEGVNYVIATSVPKDKSDVIDEIMFRLNRMRKQYEKDFPTGAPIDAVSVVRVCKNEKEYHDYGGPGGSAGYWNSQAKELVLYVGREKGFTLAVLNHEAFHQYIYYCFGELAPHSWFNEGYGDYYAGCEPSGGGITVKPFRWRVDVIKNAIRLGKHVPVKDIIRFSQGQYYSNPDICYAEGWSLIWFLNRGLPKDHEWRDILPTYFNTLQETKSMEKAVEAAFAGVDMVAFEKAWADFITKDKQAPAMGKSKGVKVRAAGGTTPSSSRPSDG